MNKRVTVIDGWAVTDNEDGSQTRARLVLDPHHPAPDRGDGVWNEGVILYRIEDNYRGTDLDGYEPMENIMTIIESGEDRNHEYRDDAPWMRDRDQVSRYLRIFHDVQFAEIMTHRSDQYRADILVVAEGIENGADPEAVARATFEEWEAWASGDVYTVEIQNRLLADAMESEDDEDGWSGSDYFGGYYGVESGREGVAEALGVSVDDVPGVYYILEY